MCPLMQEQLASRHEPSQQAPYKPGTSSWPAGVLRTWHTQPASRSPTNLARAASPASTLPTWHEQLVSRQRRQVQGLPRKGARVAAQGVCLRVVARAHHAAEAREARPACCCARAGARATHTCMGAGTGVLMVLHHHHHHHHQQQQQQQQQ